MAHTEYLALVIDVGPSICATGRKAEVVEAVQQLLLQKIMYSKRDQVFVVLCGTDGTANHLADKDAVEEDENAQYAHMTELTPEFALPTVETVRQLAEIPDSHSSGDILDAITIATDMIRRIGEASLSKLSVSSRVLVITDSCSPLRGTTFKPLASAGSGGRGKGELEAVLEPECEEIASGVATMLASAGTNVMLITYEDVIEAASAGAAASGGAGTASSSSSSSSSAGLLPLAERHASYAALRQFLDAHLLQPTGGVAHSVTDAVHAFSLLRTRSVNQVTKFRGDLDIGGEVKIPVWTYGHTVEAKPDSMKRIPMSLAATVSERQDRGEVVNIKDLAAGRGGGSGYAGGGGGDYGGDDDDEGGGGGRGSSSGVGVIFDREMYVEKPPADASGADGGDGGIVADGYGGTQQALKAHEILKAYKYGNQIVSQLPETALKLSDWEKHMCALCFTSQETIPRFVAMGQVDVLVPPPGNTLAAEALSALARALAETNEAAYVRYLKRKGGAPLMGYLIPALMADPAYEIDEEAADKAAEECGVDITVAAGDASSDDGVSSSSSRSAGAAGASGKKKRARVVHTVVPSPLGIDCLYFVPAPYQDDIRTFGFMGWKRTAEEGGALDDSSASAGAASAAAAGGRAAFAGAGSTANRPTKEQLAAADALITAMDLMHVPMPDGRTGEAMTSDVLFNPTITRQAAAVRARALDPNAPLPPLDPRVQAYLTPDAAVLEASIRERARFSSVFGPMLKRNARTETVLGPHVQLYSELQAGGGAAGSSAGSVVSGTKRGAATAATAMTGATAAKRKAAAGDDDGFSADALFGTGAAGGRGGGWPVTTIGTVDPVGDFKALLDAKAEGALEAAIALMPKAILALAKSPVDVAKAIAALQEFRRGCLAVYEENAFNAFMRDKVKPTHGPIPGSANPTGTPFWRQVVDKRIGLITEEEAESHDFVSPDDADDFLKPSKQAPAAAAPAPPPPPKPEEVDDLADIE